MNLDARNKRIFLASESGVAPISIAEAHGLSLKQIHRILRGRHGKKRTSPWTEEAVTMVKDLALANRSATQIATALKDFGIHTTRNSVTGVMDRAGIRRPDLGEKSPLNGAIAAMKKRDPNRVARKRLNPTTLNIKRAACAPANNVVRAIVGGEEREAAWKSLEGVEAVSITALKNGVCRWPLETRDDDHLTMYCGGSCAPERVYCNCHALLASVVKTRAIGNHL